MNPSINPKRLLLPALVLLVPGILWILLRESSPEDGTRSPASPPGVAEPTPTPLPAPIPDDPAHTPTATAVPMTTPRSAMPASTFREWMRTPPPANADARGAWIERGVSLAAVRRERMTGWIQNDPERALAEAVTPRQYERLPAEVRALIERPVSEEGFYGVLAVCGHGPGETHSRACEIRHEVVLEFGTPASESYNAAIHGARRERMTEENAAINGVALDKWIALYPGDVVIHDDGPAFEPNRYSVYHKGPVGTASDRTSAEALAADVPPPTP